MSIVTKVVLPLVDLRGIILARCREQLANFKVPSQVHVVDEFPRATLDKVAKAALRQTALDLQTPQ